MNLMVPSTRDKDYLILFLSALPPDSLHLDVQQDKGKMKLRKLNLHRQKLKETTIHIKLINYLFKTGELCFTNILKDIINSICHVPERTE